MAQKAKAKTISAADLAKFTKAAVKDAVEGIPGKFVGKGITMGYLVEGPIKPAQQLRLAERIAAGISDRAAAAHIDLTPKAVVVTRPGRIIAGFLTPELVNFIQQ